MSPVVTALVDPMPSSEAGAPHGRCHATARSGAPCRQPAVAGATVCRFHGGSAPQVRRAAARRLAEQEAAATLAEVDVAPIANPLEALAEVAEETRAFMRFAASHVAGLADDLTDRNDAGTEHIRAIVALYERATDRCARLLADWVRLGFDERMVTMHERQAELVDRFVTAVLDDLGLSAEQQAAASDAKVRHLHVLTEAA